MRYENPQILLDLTVTFQCLAESNYPAVNWFLCVSLDVFERVEYFMCVFSMCLSDFSKDTPESICGLSLTGRHSHSSQQTITNLSHTRGACREKHLIIVWWGFLMHQGAPPLARSTGAPAWEKEIICVICFSYMFFSVCVCDNLNDDI